MTTFLWMLYLAFTLFMTATSIKIIFNLNKDEVTNFHINCVLLTCILWSVWYFYFLH
jgi:hypothetical protein